MADHSAELGILLHLPHFIDHEPAHRKLKNVVFVVRMVCNAAAATILLLVDDQSMVGWAMVLVSLAIHFLSFLISRFFVTAPPIHPRLYRLAHVGLLNFVLDTPGRGIPTVRRSHSLIVVLSLVAVAALTFTWFLISPIQKAWHCYDPAYIASLEDYRFGVCDGGSICRRKEINCNDNSSIFANEVHYTVQGMAILFTIHLAAVGPKIDYYEEKASLGVKKRG